MLKTNDSNCTTGNKSSQRFVNHNKFSSNNSPLIYIHSIYIIILYHNFFVGYKAINAQETLNEPRHRKKQNDVMKFRVIRVYTDR